jgi:hypothetical protein
MRLAGHVALNHFCGNCVMVLFMGLLTRDGLYVIAYTAQYNTVTELNTEYKA